MCTSPNGSRDISNTKGTLHEFPKCLGAARPHLIAFWERVMDLQVLNSKLVASVCGILFHVWHEACGMGGAKGPHIDPRYTLPS